MPETALQHQLEPVTRTNTFTLSDPVLEERVKILNFAQPGWEHETAETIKEMIWETNRKRLVIRRRRQDNSWRAFHHNSIRSDLIDCGSYR